MGLGGRRPGRWRPHPLVGAGDHGDMAHRGGEGDIERPIDEPAVSPPAGELAPSEPDAGARGQDDRLQGAAYCCHGAFPTMFPFA